ncbi:MarR family transcriptional regulator [Acidisoma cellulosilytica]|uniref:MarR family transcriptional regulator n=1 Tax=Acidisoma cellulosilyticum TaxID=2802395 RepID=A0A963Z042_9PROT|nr:MarR family transcriptional regulator [Acidisoma cellulosilyticum]MCB8879552.1 MarR family transcriptional regulator [Acidisoma cellulosilyticum]
MANYPQEEDVLFLIGDIARLIGVYADRIARTRGMSKAQWVLLIKLAQNPGLSQKDLAQMMAVEPITVGRLVDRLESHGLVERVPDEQDRRVWRLQLLPAAEPVLAELAERRREIVTMIGQGIDDTTIATMRAGMVRIKTNVSHALKGGDSFPQPITDSTKAAV